VLFWIFEISFFVVLKQLRDDSVRCNLSLAVCGRWPKIALLVSDEFLRW